MKQVFYLLTLTILVAFCGSCGDKKDFEHNYTKYWEKYAVQEFKDALFADTLMIGADSETRAFYINRTQELLADLQDDSNKIDSLYPMIAFDRLTIKRLPLGLTKTFTKEQTEKFLQIINDPLSFDWAETTAEPEFQVHFLKKGKVLTSLTIDLPASVITTNPGWPNFKKMKFGGLKSVPSNDLNELLSDVR